MFCGSRMSWTNEASTNVSSVTMCAKIFCIFTVNSCFADSSIRKRTTSVILSDIPISFEWNPDLQLLFPAPCYRELRVSLVLCPPLGSIEECVERLNLASLRNNHVETSDRRPFPCGAETPCQSSYSVMGVWHTQLAENEIRKLQ